MEIDGRMVELGSIRASVGDYTVYDNKIWRIVSRCGPAVGDCKGLEREKHGEHISVSNSIKLYCLEKPTGYIDI